MSGLREPLLTKETGSRSPGNPVPTQPAAIIDQEPSAETRFLKVLKELEKFPVTEKNLKSRVLCSCSSRLGVIVGLEDGSVVLVGLDAEIYVLGRHEARVKMLCATNGIAVSGSSDKTVRIWDIENRQQLAVLEGHTGGVSCVSVTSDGKYIISGSEYPENAIIIWDLELRKQLAVLKGHTSAVSCLSVTSDGKYIVSGSQYENAIRIWDLPEQKQIGLLQGHYTFVSCVSITSNGKFIVSGSKDNTVRIWDIEEKKQLAVLKGHNSFITCLSITSDGKKIVSGSGDHSVRIWDLEEVKELAVFDEHTSAVNCLSITTDGKRAVSGSGDNTIRIWDLVENKQIASLVGHSGGVNCVLISSDGRRIVSGSDDNTIRVWDIEEKKELSILEGHTSTVTYISVTSDGKKIVSGSDDDTIQIWDLEGKKGLAVLKGHTREVTCVSVTFDGKTAVSGSNDETVRIWDLEAEKELAVLKGHTSYVRCVSVTPDGKQLVSGSDDKTIRIWDLEGKKELAVLKGHNYSVSIISITPDGKYIVSGSSDHTIRIWDLVEKRELALLEGHRMDIICLSISFDGKYLVSAAFENSIRVWDLQQRTLLQVLEGHTSQVRCLSITSDGKHFVSGSDDHTIRIWALEGFKQLAILQGHTGGVNFVLVTSDGRHIVSTSDDRTVRVWDFEERKILAVLLGHTSSVTSLAITPDGKQVISGSRDKTIRVVDLTMTIPALRSDFLGITFDNKELAPLKNCYNSGKCQDDLRQGIPISSSVASSPIMPHYFNSLHICAYYNQFTALKTYLEQGVPIIRGVFGSPLTVALMKNSTKCVNVILQYLINQANTDSGSFALQEIVDDFPTLLMCNASAKIPFFNAVLGTPIQSLPEFIVPLKPLPCTLLQTPQWINMSDFAEFKGEELVIQNAEIVQFLISRFHWNFAIGSTQSLELLRALEDCEDRHILTTPLVTSLVQNKWEKLLLITRTHTLLYLCSLVCLIGLTFNYWRLDVLNIVFLSLNGLFLLYEIVQILANGTDYWVDPWNYVDLVRGLTSVTWASFVYLNLDIAHLHYLHFAVVTLCFLRGFTFFRTFKMTRVFVRLVIEVVKEMYAFLVILAYSTISFGMMYAVLMPDLLPGAEDAWTTAYELLMGTHNEADFDVLKWLCFSAASLVNVIIMLNLLISILGDAYEKAQMSARENDNLEMLKLVIEYESMCFWRRNVRESSVLVVCKSVGDEDAEDEWTGRVNNIKRAMEKNIKDTQLLLEQKLDAIERSRKEDDSASGQKLEEKLQENRIAIDKNLQTTIEEELQASRTAIEEKLQKKLEESQTAIEEKLLENRRVMESKFDQVLAALQASH